MDRQKLSEWMQTESGRVRELSANLREHIIAVPSGSREIWLQELVQRFEHFTAHFQRMMIIEEEDGYLLPVIEVRPTLAKQVELLQREHHELRHLTEELQRTVKSLKPDENLLIRDCCTRLQIFLGHVDRHEQHENHIVLYTLSQDIGASD
ncbi:MAG: hemerythrin domain-containing protein [Planctomycetota bacterium]